MVIHPFNQLYILVISFMSFQSVGCPFSELHLFELVFFQSVACILNQFYYLKS